MVEWASEHLKLNKKPNKPCSAEAAASSSKAFGVKLLDNQLLEEAEKRFEERVFELATQMDLQTSQIGHQSYFIGILERKMGDYQNQIKGLEVDSRQWRDKVNMLEDSLQRLEQNWWNNLRQAVNDLVNEKKNEKKNETSGCFNWCR